ncbi:nucleolar protein, partial [Coemansia erecta]
TATPAKKAAPTKKAAPASKASAKKAAPASKAPAKKAAKKIEEPISESEESEAEETEAEETIYEEMSDSAAEEESSDGEGSNDEDSNDESKEKDEAKDESDSEIDEDALLAGLRGSDSELSESESEDEFTSNRAKIDLDDDASQQIQRRLRTLPPSTRSGVVYLGRIPHGFYEDEMMGYFKQFGAIKRLRLSRNPRTGRSRHYGFIEFTHEEVAKVVAETMNNYLMFDHLLKCSMVDPSKVHPRMFANRFQKIVPGRAAKEHVHVANRARDQDEVARQVDRLVAAERKKRAKLAAAGIDYDFPGYEELRPPKAKHIKFTE